MVQKTIRFYDKYQTDIQALKMINEHAHYGFNSEREMVISAILKYNPEDTGIDIERLSEKIVCRLVKKGIKCDGEEIQSKENTNETDDEDEVYKKALDFINNMYKRGGFKWGYI